MTATHSQTRPKNRVYVSARPTIRMGMNTPKRMKVESLVGQGQHLGAQEQAPRDPDGDPGQEAEADVAEIVTETVGAIRLLEARIAEPQPQLLTAKPPPGSLTFSR